MASQPTHRTLTAVYLGLFVVIAQLGAFTAIALSAWNDLFSPSTPYLKLPFIQNAQVFRGELVYPVCAMKFVPRMLQTGNAVCIRAVNLKTGRVRDLEIQDSLSRNLGLVTNGEKLWAVGNQEVYESDGADFVKIQPKRILGFQASLIFIYEGCPAIVERDSEGNYQLLALVDGDWENRGQIALPGADRTWVVDEQTGNSVLVPRTSANLNSTGFKPLQLRIVQARGQYHLFQIDGKAFRTNNDWTISYRLGFDFVTNSSSSEDQPTSALAPANAPADTTGWVQLDPKFASLFPCFANSNDNLLLGTEHEVWRQAYTDGNTISTQFERIAEIPMPENSAFAFGLVSSAETNEVYVLAGDFVKDIDVYRLEGLNLKKMSWRIEGMGDPLKLWITNLLLKGLAVVCVSTLVLVIAAAWMTGGATYSFGCETRLLAPLIRRSLARCLDLLLVFGPLTFQAVWLFRVASFDSILMMDDGLTPLLPCAIWCGLIWAGCVVSTGLWGITPGKCLFSLRVVRTSLRPCGFSRALLRELLLGIDAPQLLTVLPGVLCHLISRNRQRIGDLFADTVVIDASKVIANPIS